LDLNQRATSIFEEGIKEATYFVLAIFGDLKGYNFSYKFCIIERNATFKIVKANKMAKFMS
jgi:hypothetical protein